MGVGMGQWALGWVWEWALGLGWALGQWAGIMGIEMGWDGMGLGWDWDLMSYGQQV